MGDHSRPEQFADGPTEDLRPVKPAHPPRAVEAKLVVATTVATLLYGVLEAVRDNTELLAGLPPWAVQLIVAVIPGLLAFLAGYRVPSNRV